MTDSSNGLRFDIYERVQLPEDVASIAELEEIELVPHMQALGADDEMILRGHLMLSGIYRSDQGAALSQLEHWIPIEITMPLERVQSAEQLFVEIDHFDVDVSSERSLNVTGVLALRGLEPSVASMPVWREDSFTVVHQAPEVQELEHQEPGQQELYFQAQDQQEHDELQLPGDQQLNEQLDIERQEPVIEHQVVQAVVQPVESPEMKIAFSGKPSTEPSMIMQSGVSMLAQLGEKGEKREEVLKQQAIVQDTTDPGQQMDAQAELNGDDELEWTRLFLFNRDEQRPFRKVKLCIVQREETLESIADRYNVGTRQLQLHNQLTEAYLTEGQVLYIPVS